MSSRSGLYGSAVYTHSSLQAISSHMEERPTLNAVKHLLEAQGLEVGEKVATALLPLWDALKAMQVSDVVYKLAKSHGFARVASSV